jgi:hypothetical protein
MKTQPIDNSEFRPHRPHLVAARGAPRGRRDFGHRSAWIIGAVCPTRGTGVALVMTHLDTAAMNLFSPNWPRPSPRAGTPLC